MISNVAILTNFRTGSTTFTLEKSEEYGLPYKGELFSHERPFAIGSLGKLDIYHNRRNKHNRLISNYVLSNWNIYQELRDGAKACYKIMPSHFRPLYAPDIDFFKLETVLKEADKVYYLYRRDFRAQLKSWLAVRRDGSFGQTGFATNVAMSNVIPEESYVKRMHQLHRGTWKKGNTIHKTIDPNDSFFNSKNACNIEKLVEQLVENYEAMAKMYKKIPGELVCYEDYFSGSKYNPYNRNIKWTSEPQIDSYVNTWDIESLFKA